MMDVTENAQPLGISTANAANDLPVMYRRRWLIQIVCSTVVVVTMVVALRLFSRRLMRQKIWWDDYFCIVALVGYIANITITGVLLSMGLGLHLAEEPAGLVPATNKLHLAGQLLYQWSMMAAKTSILLMYYRIFKIMPYFRAAACVVFALVLLTALSFSLAYPFLCVPVEKLFDSAVPGRCVSPITVGIVNGSVNILTDVLTLCLPFPQVWRLPLKMMEKVTVSIAFALGLFVVFASSYRIYALSHFDPRDTLYGLVPLFGWSLIDCFAAILSACLPVMKPVLLFTLDKLRLRGEKSVFSRCWRRGRNNNSSRGGGGKEGKEMVDTTTTATTGQDSASLARKSFPRGVGGEGGEFVDFLDYTEARRHWSSASETLRGDLQDGYEGDDDDEENDDEAMGVAMNFQTMSAFKSEG